jgi:hypothetical protein
LISHDQTTSEVPTDILKPSTNLKQVQQLATLTQAERQSTAAFVVQIHQNRAIPSDSPIMKEKQVANVKLYSKAVLK